LHLSNPAYAQNFFNRLSAKFVNLHPNGGETVDFLGGEIDREGIVWQYFDRQFLTPMLDLLQRSSHQSVETFIQKATLPHLGNVGTRLALDACGIGSGHLPPPDIIDAIRRTAWRHRAANVPVVAPGHCPRRVL